MKIVISGANGQLGRCLKDRKNAIAAEWIFTDIDTLDITNADALNNFMAAEQPDFFINCAAYTAVDKAEQEPETANRINHLAPETIALNCKKYDCRLIHISTDYVFDGKKFTPYSETDECKPESVYGVTKYKGEVAVKEKDPGSIIIRTSWLYSEYGNNFMKTMIRLGSEKDDLNVVFDQAGSPTYAGSLAEGILHILSGFSDKKKWIPGTYHFANQGVCSWYDFAFWIMEKKQLNCRIQPIESDGYPTAAKRPHYSVLNKAKFEQTFEFRIPHWTKAAGICIEKL